MIKKLLILSLSTSILNANPFFDKNVELAQSSIIEAPLNMGWGFNWAGVVSYGQSDLYVYIKLPRAVKWSGAECLYPIKLRKTDYNHYYAQYEKYVFSYEVDRNKILFNIEDRENNQILVERKNNIKVNTFKNGIISNYILNSTLNIKDINKCL